MMRKKLKESIFLTQCFNNCDHNVKTQLFPWTEPDWTYDLNTNKITHNSIQLKGQFLGANISKLILFLLFLSNQITFHHFIFHNKQSITLNKKIITQNIT